jgi:DUF4097 and DUF4098 domain-containing protein YvlB
MKRSLWTVIGAAVLYAAGMAQEPASERITVTLSDPARPATIKASVMMGGIRVTAYDGKDVVVEAKARAEESPAVNRNRQNPRQSADRTEGMTRLNNPNVGLSIEEDNNVVEISTRSMHRAVDLAIQVPRRSALKLSSVNDGDITVEGVQGEMEVNNINGSVTLTGVSGSAVAHALNDDVVATFAEVTPDKPMSFSSLNGKIDVTFPSGLKAKVVLKSDNGEIYSDFEIALDAAGRKPVIEDARGKGGKYKIQLDRALYGAINGGGPEITFKTFNGDIFIRKAK